MTKKLGESSFVRGCGMGFLEANDIVAVVRMVNEVCGLLKFKGVMFVIARSLERWESSEIPSSIPCCGEQLAHD